MKPASAGLSAVASPDATLTVLNSSGNYWNLQIAIPSLNVNANLISNENIIYNLDGFTYGYSYVVVGEWDLRTINPTGPVQLSTAFASGYETPTSGMPTTGSANFSGLADGIVFKPGSSAILETVVQGRANLSVNFSSGQLTGTLTQMRAWDGSSSSGSSWNDVSLNANIAPGTNRFNGTTAATSVPGSSSSLAGSATGSINGAFYGPAAQNVGAVWSLSDGSKSAIGALAATQ